MTNDTDMAGLAAEFALNSKNDLHRHSDAIVGMSKLLNVNTVTNKSCCATQVIQLSHINV